MGISLAGFKAAREHGPVTALAAKLSSAIRTAPADTEKAARVAFNLSVEDRKTATE